MTVRERIVAALRRADGPLCDDCLVPAAQLRRRQQSNQRCRKMAEEGRVRREHGRCSECGEYKLTNALQPLDDVSSERPPSVRPPAGSGDGGTPDEPWYWEGNVQARLTSWLREQGYRILGQADTRSRQRGPDVIAAATDGTRLCIGVKGYPKGTERTRATLQARHWFGHAIFDALLRHHENPDVHLAMAFPDFPRYCDLASRLKWIRESLPLLIYWVTESGKVIAE